MNILGYSLRIVGFKIERLHNYIIVPLVIDFKYSAHGRDA